MDDLRKNLFTPEVGKQLRDIRDQARRDLELINELESCDVACQHVKKQVEQAHVQATKLLNKFYAPGSGNA